MINFRTLIFLFFVSSSHFYFAQYNGLGFIYPIDRDVIVTGNYGEIRPNHFHAGLDFSTDPKINLPIKCVADGYVSRIKISSGGYGRVIYVTHANGYVSVYAHQKKFAERIDIYTKQQQREVKKNELELFPTPNVLPVKKGEIIGYSGNSGSSTGPHLHFEIREEKSEIPINPLLVYDVKDNIKPVLTHVAIYSTRDTNVISQLTNVAVNPKTGKLTLLQNMFVLKQNTFALAFAGYDQSNGSTNKNNIYEAKVKLDGNLIYNHQLNNISFDNGRYVNYFSEKLNGIKFQKCFAPTCYDIAIYKTLVNGGKIELKDTLLHKIELIVADEKGNESTLTFFVRAEKTEGYIIKSTMNVNCHSDFVIKKEDIEYTIRAGSMVNPASVGGYFNKLGKAVIGNKNDILLKPFSLSLKVFKPIKGKENKMVVMIDDNCLTGKYENGWFKTESKSFGIFSIAYDTIAPMISFPSNKKKTKIQPALSDTKIIKFEVGDQMSGISDYNIYFNGVWQIAEYDAKSCIITCAISEKTGALKIEVTDRVGNKTVVNKEF
ncbi:MAG: M23 family metallopeptidase [Burkholderiales bacterium]|nr:M23 family metallopeptidase [Bacteroidia bacterium]